MPKEDRKTESIHYTVTINVVKVEKTYATDFRNEKIDGSEKREVTSIKVDVRASQLQKAIDKTINHLKLVDVDDLKGEDDD